MPLSPFLLPYGSGFIPTDFGAIGLAAPATLVKVAGTLTTLTVEWAAVVGASAYLAQITNESTGDVYQTHITSLLECTFDNLDPTINYSVTVGATAPGSFTISEAFDTTLLVTALGTLFVNVTAHIIQPLSPLTAQGVLTVVGSAVIGISVLQGQGTLHVTGAAQVHEVFGVSAQGTLTVVGEAQEL